MPNITMEWFRATRCDRSWITAAAALLLALALGCGGEATTPTQPNQPNQPTTLDRGPFVVSNAVAGQAVSAAVMPNGMRLGASAVSSMAYVSLPPGSIPDATSAMISTSTNSGSGVTTLIADGGFDPIPIAAEAGDTLLIQVQGTSAAAKMSYRMRVAPKTRPVVVRTTPPPHKRDVALNYLIQVVFSEPMDGVTLGGAVRLSAGGAPVPGEVQAVTTNGVVLKATFAPATPLVPGTEYQLSIDTTAHDAGGDALAVPIASDFTTAPAEPDSLAGKPAELSVTVLSPGPDDSIAGDYMAFKLHIDAPLGLASVFWSVDSGFPGGEIEFGDANSFSGDAYIRPFESPSAGTHVLRVTVFDATGQASASEPAPLRVVAPDSTPRLVARSFEVLEIGANDSWEYVPQLTMAEAPGGTGLTILGFEMVTVPGLPSPFPRMWVRLLRVPPGEDVPLVGEVYGSWELAYTAVDLHRSTGGNATARITYQDDSGHVYVNTLEGPIVPGALPTTYSGTCGHFDGAAFFTAVQLCPPSLAVTAR